MTILDRLRFERTIASGDNPKSPDTTKSLAVASVDRKTGFHIFDRRPLSGIVINDEMSALIRFAVIGALTALIYLGTYLILRAGTDLHAAIDSIIAYAAAIAFQYVGHARYTFRKQLASRTQLFRFLINNAIGCAVAAIIMSVAPALLVISEFQTGLIVIATLPLYNWIMMRFWVYR